MFSSRHLGNLEASEIDRLQSLSDVDPEVVNSLSDLDPAVFQGNYDQEFLKITFSDLLFRFEDLELVRNLSTQE